MSDEMRPPAGDTAPEVPEAPAPPTVPEPPTPPASTRTVEPGFLILGLLTPFIVSFGLGILTSALLGALGGSDTAGAAVGIVTMVIPVVVLIGVIVAFVRGRVTGNDRLRSFGLGGIIAYVATMLLSLLAFGACFVLAGPNFGF